MSKLKGVSLGAVLWQLLPAFLICGVFAAVGVMHVTSRVMVVGVGYELSRLEGESRELTRENDRLKLELATLKSPARLEQVAREQLGMTPPPPGAVLTLGPGANPLPDSALVSRTKRKKNPVAVALEDGR